MRKVHGEALPGERDGEVNRRGGVGQKRTPTSVGFLVLQKGPSVTREAFEFEIDYYIAQTAQMQVPEGDHTASFLQFAEEVLDLIRGIWPAESSIWHRALKARQQGSLSTGERSEVQSEIASYRLGIGEPYGMNEPHSDQAAVSFLFALAIESPGVSAHEYRLPQLARLLDEFSCEFIEHFGRAREVVQALKGAFRVGKA